MQCMFDCGTHTLGHKHTHTHTHAHTHTHTHTHTHSHTPKVENNSLANPLWARLKNLIFTHIFYIRCISSLSYHIISHQFIYFLVNSLCHVIAHCRVFNKIIYANVLLICICVPTLKKVYSILFHSKRI